MECFEGGVLLSLKKLLPEITCLLGKIGGIGDLMRQGAIDNPVFPALNRTPSLPDGKSKGGSELAAGANVGNRAISSEGIGFLHRKTQRSSYLSKSSPPALASRVLRRGNGRDQGTSHADSRRGALSWTSARVA